MRDVAETQRDSDDGDANADEDMPSASPTLPQNVLWEYKYHDMWKTLDDEVCRSLTDAFNEGRADTTVTRPMDEEYSYNFNLREMSVAEYWGRTLQRTYKLRVIKVVRCGEE